MTTDEKIQDASEKNDGALALNIISWIFGIAAFAIGVVNTFWGNDPGYGIFVLLLSLLYLIQVNHFLLKFKGLTLTRIRIVKTLLGLFIIWSALGVGELFDKIELMLSSF